MGCLKLAGEFLTETSYGINVPCAYVDDNERKLLLDQRRAYDTVVDYVRFSQGAMLFLDASGGQKFVTKLLLVKVRQYKEIAFAVASSGIAATMSPVDRTAHSTLSFHWF